MRRLRPIIASAAAGALFVLALPLTGLLEHSARPGSNAIVDWYTITAARQSIALRSLTTSVPDLEQLLKNLAAVPPRGWQCPQRPTEQQQHLTEVLEHSVRA